MSLVRQSTDQFRDAFTGMPMQSRVISVMLVVAIAIGLGLLVRGDTSVDGEYLFGGRTLGEQEIDAVEMSFSRAGLNEWTREGRRIKIPNQSRSDYLAALQDSASLPMSLRSSVQDAIDKASPFESSEQRMSREMHAKEQDLGNKIAAFPEIRWASVEYDRGERYGLDRLRPQSASVVIAPEGTDALTKQRIQMIKELIRGSYAGMSSDEVVVIDTNASSSSSISDDDDPLLRKRREAEASYEQKVRNILSGYGPIRVATYCEIDPTMEVEKTVVKYDSERTTLSDKSKKVESSSNRPLNQGVPGAVPNAIGNRGVSLEDVAQTTSTKEDERESNGVAGQQYENSRIASLQVKRVRVSVGLPTSYYQTVWGQTFLQENPDKTAADVPNMQPSDLEQLREQTKGSIQTAITPLLPAVAAGEDRFPLVEVWDFPDLPEPAPIEPEKAKAALTWLADSWQTIALIILALAALLVARSAASATGSHPPSEFAEGFGLELPAPPPDPEDAADDGESMTITGGSLKDELLVLVEGNPEVAANVIRGWVAEAA